MVKDEKYLRKWLNLEYYLPTNMVKDEKYLQKWLNLEYYVPTNMVKDEWRECPRSSSCQFRPQRTDKSAWPSRESEVTSSTFISNSKLLLQIFQNNMKKYIQNIKIITRWCYTSAGKSEWSYCAPPSKVLI